MAVGSLSGNMQAEYSTLDATDCSGKAPAMSAAHDDLPADTDPERLPVLEADVPDVTVETVTEVIALDVVSAKETPTIGKFRLPHAGHASLWVLFLLGTQLAVGVVAGGVLMVLMHSAGGHITPSSQNADFEKLVSRYLVPFATFATVVTSLGVVFVAFRRETERCMGLRGMTATQTLLVLLGVLPCALLASEVTNCAMEFMPNVSLDLFGDFAQESWWLIFISACLFPGFGEELFFRGFLSRGLVAHHGVWRGTLITAFLFGAVHLHPIQACGAFALGVALQFVFLTTRSLWGAILLHTANNAVAFLAMRYGHLFPIPGFTTNSPAEAVVDAVPTPHYDQLIDKLKGVEPIMHTPPLLLAAASIAVAALAWALLQTRTRWVRADGTEWSRGFLSAEGPRPEVAVRKICGSLDVLSSSAVVLASVLFVTALIVQVQR